MSDSDSQEIEKKKSPVGIILLLVLLLVGLSGAWIYHQQSKNYLDIVLTDNEAGDTQISGELNIEELATPRILGDANAPVKISEYSSFTCPHCATYHESNFKKIKADYIDTGKAYLVYDDFPRNPTDVTIGAIARCVPGEGYFTFIQGVFETQDDWSGSDDYVETMKKNAVAAGADADQVEKCAESAELKKAIAMRAKKAYDEKTVKGTPTIIIDGNKLSGVSPYEDIQAAMDKALSDAKANDVVDEVESPAPIETAAGEETSSDADAATSEETTEVNPQSAAVVEDETLDVVKASKPRIYGDVNAPIKISEHSSFTCPHCAKFHNEVFDKLKEEYLDTGKAYLIYDDFPLSGADVMIGALTRCVPTDSYFKFVQFIFKNQEDWKKLPNYIDYLKQNAKLTGASDEYLQQCLDSKELQENIALNGRNAYERKGVQGTPTIIINDGKPVSALSPYFEIKIMLDAELRKAGQ
tara:strand:+ start:8611 stop:10020 length:1410 start_codon:yes stop_codon:yes gene_type:complete